MAVPALGLSSIGLPLLRLAPFTFSTTLLINRTAQYYALSSFLPPYLSPGANAGPTFQLWFRAASSRIWKGAIAATMLLRIACLANVVIQPAGPLTRWLYGVGLALAFGHVPVAPRLLVFEKEMKDEKNTPEQSLEGLKKWLKVNNVRLLVLDLPLWIVTAVAVAESFNPR